MKKILVFLLVIGVAAVVALAIFVIKDRQESKPVPGSVFKATFEECDKTGYGYKGMCYGNLAVLQNDKSLCDRIPEIESFNKKRCEDYYKENKK